MLIFTCDKCKKKIKNRASAVDVSRRFNTFSFCEKCARPISKFLSRARVERLEKKVSLAR